MKRGDAYHWRLLATAVCFVVFGASCLVLGLIVFPLLRLFSGGAAAGHRRIRRTLGLAMRVFLRLTALAGVLTFEFRGAGALGRPGQIILANHPTLIDAVFLLGFAPDANCVVKRSLWANPFTHWPLVAAGYVRNRPTEVMIVDTAAALAAGQSVIIFPEGTRTTPGEPLYFHRGAAAIAIRAATVVTPVYIRCEPPTLAKGDPWYHIPARRPHFRVRVGTDIAAGGFRARGAPPLAARALNAHLLEVFSRELASG